jgi:MYXO-CTERM domain-containing protein
MRLLIIGLTAACLVAGAARAAHAWGCQDYSLDTAWPRWQTTPIGTGCPLLFVSEYGYYEPESLRAVYHEDDEPIEVPLEAHREEITLTMWWSQCAEDCETYRHWQTQRQHYYYELVPTEPLPADRELRLVYVDENGATSESWHVRWRTGDEETPCATRETIPDPACSDAPCEHADWCQGDDNSAPDPNGGSSSSSGGCSTSGGAHSLMLIALVLALAGGWPRRRPSRTRS